MVSFIHNGSETTIWMEYSFKTKSTKAKAKQLFSDKNIFFESYAADHWMSTRTLIVRQLTNSNFHSYT